MADLSHIFRALSDLNSGISSVQTDVADVDGKLVATRGELALLQRQFGEFLNADRRAKEIQLAETRQVKVRQELENKYGHYATIRRHATGILQASDLTLVRQETIACATEELMLLAPGYWLAPALVGLSAWLRDDRDLAERAIAEATRRDDEKCSLFLALLGRRADRPDVCRRWLDRYLEMQDPTQLDRQCVVLIDALASGVFGVEVRQKCSQRLAQWVQELTGRPNFVDEQRRQWTDALLSKSSSVDRQHSYPYLSKYSPTWGELQKSLNSANTHSAIMGHFNGIFAGEIQASASLQSEVDALLTKLVTHFDDEELPLRRTDRFLELIIQEGGDRDAATAKSDLEATTLDEQISFMQLLTNAAMHPETSHASLATQRLAVSASRHWIKEAYADLLAAFRQAVPTKIALNIEGFQGETRDGSNERELIADMQAHFERLKQEKLASLQFGVGQWAIVAGGAIALLFGLGTAQSFISIIGVGLLVWAGVVYWNQHTAREKLEVEHAQFVAACEGILKATLSETVEWQREHARLDAVSENVTALLERLAASQHIQTKHDTSRQIAA